MDNITGGVVQTQPIQSQPIQNGQVQQNVQVQPVQPIVQAQPQPQQNVQLFTQEQVNSIVGGRVNQLNQKNAELSAQINQLTQLNADYLAKLTGYQNKEIAAKAGVPAQFVDYAIYEAGKLAVNGKSFEDAIKEIASANAQLFGANQMGNQSAPVTPNGQQIQQGLAPIQATQQQAPQAQPQIQAQAQVQPSQAQPIVQPTQAQPQPAQYQAVQPTVFSGATSVAQPNGISSNNLNAEVSAFLASKTGKAK